VHGRTWSALPDFDLQAPGAKVSLMDALAAAGVAAYAVDLRGYGGTPRDATGFATPERSAADVAEVLRFVEADAGAGRPYLLGWSLGSLVSALTVQTWPESAAGVVLYGHPCRGGGGGAKPAAKTAAKAPVTAPATELPAPKRAVNTAASAASDFITPGSVSREVIDAFVAAALQADPVRADWRGGSSWDGLRFAALRVPVLVIHGERDPVSTRGCMASRFAELEGSDRRSLFSGDCVFWGGKIVIQNVVDVSVPDYAESLKKLRQLEFDALLPGHLAISLSNGKRHVVRADEEFRQIGVPRNLLA